MKTGRKPAATAKPSRKTENKPAGGAGSSRKTGTKPPSRAGKGQRRLLEELNDRIVACRLCPRLITHCEKVAIEKKRAHREESYWGRPVPSFGDPRARLLILGLAPAAHGANRTGRMFTGDSSGDWLFEALHRHGFASQAASTSREDGLSLMDAWITATNHCAPPDNKPSIEEQTNCRTHLSDELDRMKSVRVVLVLGKIAFDGFLKTMAERGHPIPRPRPVFRHAATYTPFGSAGPVLVCSYHPSRQNTNTGKLTRAMFYAPIRKAGEILAQQG